MINNEKIVQSRCICTCYDSIKDISCDALIINTTPYGVNFAFITQSNLYENIDDAKIGIFDGNNYVCFDRVTYIGWDKFSKIHEQTFERLTIAEFNRIAHTIHQFNIGDIKWSNIANRFVYRDEYSAIKNSLNFINLEDTPTEPHPIEESLPTVIYSNTDLLNFREAEIPDDILYSISNPDISDVDITAIIRMTKELDVNSKIQKNPETGGDEVIFDLIEYRKSTNDNSKSKLPSKARYRDKNKNTGYKRRWFTVVEVESISKSSSNAVASKYECTSTVATIMIRNAKRILNLAVGSHIVTNRFTCYFNAGKTVEEVAKIYPNVSMSSIATQYKQWLLNANYGNNPHVLAKWSPIIEANDRASMIWAISKTIDGFAAIEGCSKSLARDLYNKMYDILAYNPLLCVGYKDIAFTFDKDVIWNRISELDLMDNPKDRDIAELEVYRIVERLHTAYQDSYNDHFDILIGKKKIPDSVAKEDHQYFKSLIWNRFNRVEAINRNRELSPEQIHAIKTGNKRAVAIYFMLQYDKASNIVTKYKSKL